MADYAAPTREMDFVMNEVLDYSLLNQLDSFSDASSELTGSVLEEAGKFADQVLAPLNRIGDTQGVRIEGDQLHTADGFKEAYQMFVENEWLSLAQDPRYGGQGLPFLVHLAASEMWHGACTSLALCPLLTAGGIDALQAHANDELKDKYLPSLVSGKWTATMNLTEPHAGSDLSTLKTRAEPKGDHYLLRGQKIYITWGEHDMTENIIHIVLAPMIDAPPGNKGLSLFLVPKFLVNDDGSLGERNDLKVVSSEEKLGIHASPTCVMSFGESRGAVGYLIGEPGDGLACMFTLMNHARLEVGLQAVAIAERSYQDALGYAKDRVQGRNVETGAPAAIIEHADVQRMLMQMKSTTEAMRCLAYDGAYCHDLRIHGDADQRRYYNERFALLTPVVKAWCSELVNEVTSLGIQVHGGMGFVEESGAAQHYRDARITAIYEGTNGIQANDLVGRKVLRDQGAALNAYLEEIEDTAAQLVQVDSDLAESLTVAAKDLGQAARFLLENAQNNQRFVGAVAYNFLMMMGYVSGAYYMARAALQVASKKNDEFYQKKQISIKFYFGQVLPRYLGYMKAVTGGAEVGIALSEDAF